MTAQGLYQGIFVMCVPPLMGLFSLRLIRTSCGHFHNAYWVVDFDRVVVLEVVGFFVIMKVIKIDV